SQDCLWVFLEWQPARNLKPPCRLSATLPRNWTTQEASKAGEAESPGRVTSKPEVMLDCGANGQISLRYAVVVSSRSGCRRAIEMLCAYLLAFHTSHEADETDSATQTCVPRPSASVPTWFHAVCCALQAAAECRGHEWCDGFLPRHKPDHLVRSWDDSAA